MALRCVNECKDWEVSVKRLFRTFTSIAALSLAAGLCAPAFAQIVTAAGTNRPLELSQDSPFRDPDIIYLEADDLLNDESAGLLTAQGDVEGRYQDRTLRADSVVYNLETGLVIATGNVVLIDATGAIQYADKLELSDELEAGTAANFTARTPTGGITAARFVTRNDAEEVELYNAYYTACKICSQADGETKKPTWRLKARRVRQDKDSRTIRYNDAVFELAGVPIFYTPYLAHPDPSADRATGFLAPFGGFSGNRGLEIETPYYIKIDDYTEATLKPRFFTKVNPLLEYQIARNFNTGRIDVDGSITYGSVFDRDGNAFDDPALFTNNAQGAPLGRRVRSHFNASGEFNPNDTWGYGFGVQLSTDDNFLQRYDIAEDFDTPGLIERESRRNVSQAYLVGQDDDFRFAITAAGFQDLRSRVIENAATGLFSVAAIDDATLPIIAPRIEAEKYFTDPILGGRAKAYGDFTALTREVGTDYLRASAGVDYAKSTILPGGIEAKGFANARFDQFDIEVEDGQDGTASAGLQGNDVSFSRGLAQIGTDIRYPFIKQGANVTWILEPRVQATYSFGDGKLENFENFDVNGNPISLQQDGIGVDFDQALFWQSNKSTGFDFWQEGFRADIGAAIRADWGPSKNAELFIGQSYASDSQGDFDIGSGLENNKSDIVGLFNTSLSSRISASARVRFDDDTGSLRRVDSNLRYTGKKFGVNARYFRLDSAANDLVQTPLAPLQEISGSTYLQLNKNWRANYLASYDIDANTLRHQTAGLSYSDDCTRFEFFYTRRSFDNDAIRDTSSFGIRFSLLTLGDFGTSTDDINRNRR